MTKLGSIQALSNLSVIHNHHVVVSFLTKHVNDLILTVLRRARERGGWRSSELLEGTVEAHESLIIFMLYQQKETHDELTVLELDDHEELPLLVVWRLPDCSHRYGCRQSFPLTTTMTL